MSFLPESFTAAYVTDAAADSTWAPIKDIPEGNVACDGCRGDGVFYGRGGVVNGVFVGFTGTCFRCGGKGSQTPADVKRNTFYDNRVRRYNAG
jgi:DnaJ-class molecular chaperone